MGTVSRRRLLLSAGAVASLAGCLGDRVDGIIDGDHRFRGGSMQVIQGGTSLTMVPWSDRDMDDDQHALFANVNVALDRLHFDTMEEEDRVRVVQFIEETDFPNERLLFVGTVGSQHEYWYALVQSITIESGTLFGTVAAYAEEGPESDDFNYPTVLIRLQFDDEPLDRGVITVIQGGGRERVGGGRTTEYEVTVAGS